MVNCYSLVLSQLSTTDNETGQISIFKVIHKVRVSQLGIAVPFELISFWDATSDIVGKDVKFRVVIEDEEGEVVMHSEETPINIISSSVTLKITPMVLPGKSGNFSIRLESNIDGTWIKQNVSWPLSIEKIK